MSAVKLLETFNARPVALDQVPELSLPELRDEMLAAMGSPACRVLAFFALPEGTEDGLFRLVSVLGDAAGKRLLLGSSLCRERYASFTPSLPMVDWFEREIAEQYGVEPAGHPWLKPIRFHEAWNGRNAFGRGPLLPGVADNFRLEGRAAHEVAVGPVHAGVIEPGHFRFQCLGEDVFHLEISLGYQHRGVERLLEGGPEVRTIPWLETVAGDSTVASAWAGCALMEGLGGVAVPEGIRLLRSVLLELERVANHTGDLGALAGDVAYLPTASFCGRIRGDLLNLTALLTGNRFGRNALVPGGSRVGLEPATAGEALVKLRAARRDLEGALALMFDAPSVLDRLEQTGRVPRRRARELGLTGLAARASGLAYDARADFPLPGVVPYASTPLPAFQEGEVSGDVFCRARQRRLELAASFDWLERVLAEVAESGAAIAAEEPSMGPLAANRLAVSVVEGWRGELVHVGLTDGSGRFRRYKIVDPSFRNWTGLAFALRGEQISNFPICNKSFNLSYCGTDL